jgi:hypothetical protein
MVDIIENYTARLHYIIDNNKVAQWVAIIKLKKDNKDLYSWLLQSTPFLPETVKVTERIYCIINNISAQPVCKMCGKTATFRDYTFGYNTYCGPKCSANDPDSKEKKKATNRQRYGADYFLGTKECLKKTKATCQEKYGVDNVKQLDETTLKIRKTNLKNRGFEHHTQDPIYIKEQQTRNLTKWGNVNPMNTPEVLAKNKAKFGSEHYMCTAEFREKSAATLQNVYGVDNILQVPEIKARALATNLKLYGNENFSQSHYTNFEYWNDIEYIKKHFITDRRVDYTKAKLFFNAAYETLLNHFKNELQIDIENKGTSQDEIDIITYIHAIVPGATIQQGNRTLLKYEEIIEGCAKKKHKELDIYLPEFNLAIEFDGIFWHSIGTHGHTTTKEENKRRRTNAQMKVNMLAQKGIKLLSIWENEWHTPYKQKIWKSMIRASLGKTRKIFARKCDIKSITPKEEIIFLKENHMQGYVGGTTHRYGLFYKGVLKAVMTFGKARFNNDFADFELLRFATERKHTIVGGASKLLSYFQKEMNYPTILSYANKRWSMGKLYEALGFVYLKTTNPSSYYFKNSENGRAPKMLHWGASQKHKIEKLVKIYNPELSAQDNLFFNGYRKIYDAGQLVYLLK